jgi:hypothetical protein
MVLEREEMFFKRTRFLSKSRLAIFAKLSSAIRYATPQRSTPAGY